MEWKPSKYQEDIFDFAEYDTGNAVIEAVAGSGKTTTILKVAEQLPKYKTKTFCAFSNQIVKELVSKMPPDVNVLTIHSIGWRSMIKYYGHNNLKANKCWEICKKIIGNQISPKKKNGYFWKINRLVDLMRNSMVLDYEGAQILAALHNITYDGDDKFIVRAMTVLAAMVQVTDVFDFTDMIFVPALNEEIPIPQTDWLFVDECQDLTIAQQMVLDRMVSNNSRSIYVGDRRQTIYGFRGSDVKSFEKLIDRPNTKVLPLSICYRCPITVVKEAKKIVPHIEYFEGAKEGYVGDGDISEIIDGDWVLCRNVKPLVVLCISLLKDQKNATILGKNIGQGMIQMLKKFKTNNKTLVFKKLDELYVILINDLKSRGISKPSNHPKAVDFQERLSVIKFLGDGVSDVKSIVAVLFKIFSDTSSSITLSTIHKSKGLEGKRIHILRPDLIPSKYATEDWQKEQEENLRYVAITRSQNELFYIRDFDYNKVKM